jgi:hypothetical protein
MQADAESGKGIRQYLQARQEQIRARQAFVLPRAFDELDVRGG